MPVPDYAEPLIGWRLWKIVEPIRRQYRLGSVTLNEQWEPFEALESVHREWISWGDENGVPEQHSPTVCDICGVYAYRSEENARANMEKLPRPCMVGTVYLWGEVVIHERGYRAQFAYPKEFLYAQDCDGEQLARIYGVPYTEDPSWKSVIQYEPSSSNHWGIPSLFGNGGTWMGLPRFTNLLLPNQPWSSPYLLHPDDHKFIVEPPEPKLPEGVKIPDIVRPKQWQRASGIWAPCVDPTYELGVDVGSDDGSFTAIVTDNWVPPEPEPPFPFKFYNVTIPISRKDLLFGIVDGGS